MRIWINGRVAEASEAVVSVYDHGFLYGMGLFETFRTYGGRPFLLERHIARLREACESIGLLGCPSACETAEWVSVLLEANGLTDAYFRLTVTAGEGELGLPSGDYAAPTVVLYVKPLPPKRAAEPRALQLLQLRRNTPEAGDIRFKSLHYMNNILGKRELARYPWAAGAEGLFLDAQGHVAEGLVSNLFWAESGTLYTPSLDTGILPGVTRGFVLDLLREQGLRCVEGRFGWAALARADEAFLTNSIQEIVPVGRLLDREGRETRIGAGAAGRLTLAVSDGYEKAIRAGR